MAMTNQTVQCYRVQGGFRCLNPALPGKSTCAMHTARTEQAEGAMKCLCGASTVGAWTAGNHHGLHRCARVITR
jgi:hypothetical protein